jgi:hypothetical protein
MISVSTNNGRASASDLSALPGTNGDGSAHTAPHVTAQSYARVRSAMAGAGLGDLYPSDGWSCYRDLDAQQHMRDIGLTTIPVGQSIHGEWTYGSAVDFANLGGFGAPRHDWLRDNGPAYGWRQPSWASAGGSLPEPWHWEYDQRDDTHEGEEVDDMTPDQASQLQDIFVRVRSLGGTDPNQPLTIGDNFQVVASRTSQVPEIYDRIRGTDPSGDMLQIILQDVHAVGDNVIGLSGRVANLEAQGHARVWIAIIGVVLILLTGGTLAAELLQ